MRTSVLIPTYNAARTVAATIDSVLNQTVRPLEVLVLDDGSTDETVAILESYGDRIALARQANEGVAAARSTLVTRARGDLIAFLDHDDIWHPDYLAVQERAVEMHPGAVAYFTGHTDLFGYGSFVDWPYDTSAHYPVELVDPRNFLIEYCTAPGRFASASYMCVPKTVFEQIDGEPFRVAGADDSYLITLFPLLGSVAYVPAPLVAYRFTTEAQSTDWLKMDGLRVEVFELLESRYRDVQSRELRRAFSEAFAMKERQYAKRLLGVGETSAARGRLRSSIARSRGVTSLTKSAGVLAASFLPQRLQPVWPSAQRHWDDDGFVN